MIQDQRILEEEEIASKLALTVGFEEIAKKEETTWNRGDLGQYGLNRGIGIQASSTKQQ